MTQNLTGRVRARTSAVEQESRQQNWSSPAYSRSAVNKAARTYMDPDAADVDRELALLIMNN